MMDSDHNPVSEHSARLEVSNGQGEPFDELNALRSWLSDEPEFRGRVRFVESAPSAGEMSGGGYGEALVVAAVSGGGALSVLAMSVSTWLKTRRSSISIKIVDPNGTATEIKASGPVADAVIRELGQEEGV